MSHSTPIHLQVEPTQICNLHCVGCSRRDVPEGKKPKTLTLDDFKTLVAHAPSVNDISLHGLGEPFFNNDLDKIAAFLKRKGIVARTLTNGNVFNSNINNRVLLENLQEIGFSIDGDNKITYESIRCGGNFEKFKKFVSNISELKKNGKYLSCKLSFNCVISNMNIDNVSGILELAKELRIDSVSFNFVGQFYYSKKDGNYNKVEKIRNLNKKSLSLLMERLKKQSNKLGIEISHPIIGNKRYRDCFWPIRASFVTAEGYVTPCNYRMDPKIISFGNLLTQTMEEIWNSEKYVKFRESFSTKKYYKFCLTCD